MTNSSKQPTQPVSGPRSSHPPPDHPIVDPDRGLVFFWTPRCGSTTFLIWFFHLIGWGERLRAASAHQLRERWLAEHEEIIHDERLLFRDPGMRRIVIARDPYSRAVSSYYLILVSEPAKQWASVQRAVPTTDEARRLTWLEWLDFLEHEDLERCNIHWRLQSAKRWWELRTPVEVFRTETLNDQLAALGRELGVAAPLRRASATPPFERSLEGVDLKTMAKPELEALLGREDRRGKLRFPAASAFLDPESVARLTRLYAQDLKALGYNPRA